MKDIFTFENVMAAVKLFSVLTGVLVIIKQRADVIIAKNERKKALKEKDEFRNIAKQTVDNFEFIGETLMGIVHSSKMTPEEKLKVTSNYIKLKEESEVFLQTSKEEKTNIAEVIKDVGGLVEDVAGYTSGILNNDGQ